jgi:hypothetical protein
MIIRLYYISAIIIYYVKKDRYHYMVKRQVKELTNERK